jgi:drug/metabolite transporter (DMT)-like permease
MTTRFLIAPLMANLFGLILLRPHVEIRAWIGLLLVACGAGWLLLAPVDEPEGGSSTLQLKIE